MLKRIGVTSAVNEKVTRIEFIFAYNLLCPKGYTAPIITQDKADHIQQLWPLPNPNRRSTRLNKYVSPRTTGIDVVALNQCMGNAFLKKMRQTVTVNDTLLEPKEIVNGVVYPVTKEAITR